MSLEGLRNYCTTERQREILEARIKCTSNRKTAKELKIDSTTVDRALRRIKQNAARQGYSPEHDMNQTVPDGFLVKGTSTLYDDQGKPKLQWVKSQIDRERQLEIYKEALEALCSDITPTSITPAPKHSKKDLLTVYPFGDPHIGVRTYFSETGEDYDLDKAEKLFTQAMDRAVFNAPASQEALIVNVGDYFHSDNAQNRTRKSGNPLDVCGSFSDRLMIGMRIMRNIIDRALQKHKKVTVINTIGNHDEHLSIALSVMLNAFYNNEKRVVIPVIEKFYQYFTFGKCLFGVTHGDQCKPGDLEGIMAADKPAEWGSSLHRYWLTGHIHHDVIKEFRGCKFESFRTLAPKDAWHTAAGYRSDRDLKTIVYHKDHGEVERYTCNITQFQTSPNQIN